MDHILAIFGPKTTNSGDIYVKNSKFVAYFANLAGITGLILANYSHKFNIFTN